MKCVILQPSYLPWRGYFHQIQKADVFVFYDDVQFDKGGWRNRNRIKTPRGAEWLTIPVHSNNHLLERTTINEIRISWNVNWPAKHWKTIKQLYAHAPYFKNYALMLEEFYCRKPELLSDFTIETTVALAQSLGIERTRFIRSSTLDAAGAKTDRLIEILKRLGATHYISGPAAKAYLDDERFQAEGIVLEYMSYDYPEYPQLYPPYDPQVSIIDLLLMTGPQAAEHIWGPNG